MPSYTLEIEAFGVFTTNMPSLEIWEDGVLDSTRSISSSGSTISVIINYGGTLPTSLALTFNDGFASAGRTIEVRSVKINNKYVNMGNYLSSDSLTKGQSATVDMASVDTNDSDFIFDSSEPASSEFTTGATRTFTTGNDTARYYKGTSDEIFDALAGRDVIYLGSGDDKVSGNAGDDLILGGAGDDLLSGGADNDRIYGGDDDDRIYGGTGNDRLHGEGGNDEIHGGDGTDFLNGHDGDDVLTGGAGNDRLNGGNDVDFLYGGDGDDTLVSGNGDDTIDGGEGNDLAYGGNGIDYIDGGDGDDVLVGNAGDDTIDGGDDNDTIYGQQDNDELYGGDGEDTIYGGGGGDSLSGDAGDDILNGGDGTDTASYISASSSVTADLGVENHALDFEGGNDTVLLSGLGLSGASGSKATVEFWMEWDGVNNMMPFGFGPYDLWFSNGHFGFNNGSSLVYGISSAGLENTAVHVASVFVDSNTLASQLYINGVEQTLTVRQGSVNNGAAQITANSFISGYGSSTAYKFDGTIDNLRIWDGERTAAEINQYMNYSITTPKADLEANYRFEDISTGTGGVIDSSGNTNHGTLSGMTTGNQITWGNSGVSNGYSTGGADNDIIQNVENLIGSNFDDTLSGDLNDNVIEGRGGRDTIFGEDGDDTIDGGDGDDTILGGEVKNNPYAWIEDLKDSGMVLWLDGADEGTILDSSANAADDVSFSGSVATWEDKSGNGNDATGTSATLDTINGMTSVRFTNDIMTTVDLFGGSVSEIHVFVVTQENVRSSNFLLNFNGNDTSGGGRVSFHSPWSDGTYYWDPDLGERTAIGGTPTAVGGVTLANAYSTVSGSQSGLILNNGAYSDIDAGGVASATTGGLRMGSTTTDHEIAELIVFDRKLSDAEADIVENYLETKWQNGSIDTDDYTDYTITDGDDTIYGGAGADTLYGGDGADTFIFEAASAFASRDTIQDFHVSQDDVLDISDLIVGAYSGTITDYLRLTDNGSNTFVQVDANGTTGGASFTRIATLEDIVGLDEATLLANGNVVV